LPTLPTPKEKRWTLLSAYSALSIGCMQILFLTNTPSLLEWVWVPIEAWRAKALMTYFDSTFYLLHPDPHPRVSLLCTWIWTHTCSTLPTFSPGFLALKMLVSQERGSLLMIMAMTIFAHTCFATLLVERHFFWDDFAQNWFKRVN